MTNKARQIAVHVRHMNLTIRSDNEWVLKHLHKEYFVRQTMFFESRRIDPLIIDCGAHVGVSVLYWKSLYPEARVIAFEPDPANFAFLEVNCSTVTGIDLHNAAVWISNGIASFTPIGSTLGHMSELTGRQDRLERVMVKTERLGDYLETDVDLLKLDIEGAEVDVLADCAEGLANVRNIFVEFHSFIDRPQRLATLVSILEQCGFRLHAHSEMPATQPFVDRPVWNQMDFHLNIFGFRAPV